MLQSMLPSIGIRGPRLPLQFEFLWDMSLPKVFHRFAARLLRARTRGTKTAS